MRRGRKPKVPLMEQVGEGYARLHNLDWLQECELTKLSAVRQRTQAHEAMPEGQALRRLLIEVANQAAQS